MRRLSIVLVCCLVALFLGCGGVGLAYEKRLVGNIGLSAVDKQEQMAVVEFNGSGADVLVPQTVVAVGWDQAHIIAKRHPSEGSGPVDREITQFYIVTVRDRKVHEPFGEPEYHSQRRVLGVAESLDFTLRFGE